MNPEIQNQVRFRTFVAMFCTYGLVINGIYKIILLFTTGFSVYLIIEIILNFYGVKAIFEELDMYETFLMMSELLEKAEGKNGKSKNV